jgi:transposase-like protein
MKREDLYNLKIFKKYNDINVEDATGYVYIWIDTKYPVGNEELHPTYYIGSHMINNKKYIGSGKYFRNSYNKRPGDFKIYILELCIGERMDIFAKEQYWLDLIKRKEFSTKYFNCNVSAGDGFMLGFKHSDESKIKMSNSKLKGKAKLTREQLVNLYINQKLSTIKIAHMYDIDKSTILCWMDEYGIVSRTDQVAKFKGTKILSKEELVELYEVQKLSTRQIAATINSNHTTIKKWLKKYNIKRRTSSEGKFKGTKILSKEELVELYTNQRLSTTQIGKLINSNRHTILKWLRKYNIETRNNSKDLINTNDEISPGS